MKLNWGEIVGIICVPAIIVGVLIYTDDSGKALTDAHYIGDVIITSPIQEDAITATIKANADYGDLNVWKPGYDIETIDNGTVLHYGFFSKNKDLTGFTKSK